MKINKDSNGPPPAEDNKQRILQAALREFTERGLDGARVERIAESAGVNKALLYYYYSSKENLFSAVVDEHFRMILPLIRKTLEDTSDPGTALRQVAAVYAELSQRHPEFIRLLVRELAQPNSPMVVRAAKTMKESGVPGLLRRLLSEGQAKGTIREFDLRQAAVSFITMNLGYFIMAPIIDRILQIEDRERFVSERVQANVDLFLRGVTT